jgi:hypothetical protein
MSKWMYMATDAPKSWNARAVRYDGLVRFRSGRATSDRSNGGRLGDRRNEALLVSRREMRRRKWKPFSATIKKLSSSPRERMREQAAAVELMHPAKR